MKIRKSTAAGAIVGSVAGATVGSSIGIAALGVATSGALPLAIVGGAVGGYLVRKADKKLRGRDKRGRLSCMAY